MYFAKLYLESRSMVGIIIDILNDFEVLSEKFYAVSAIPIIPRPDMIFDNQ